MHLGGQPIYLPEVIDACLLGRLNLFLQGDTGSGKTQAAKDVMSRFGDRSVFLLGRNDMDSRQLFEHINLGKMYARPSHKLEPIVNPDSGEVEWYYPQPNDAGLLVPKRLDSTQAERVRQGLDKIAGNTEGLKELTSKINTRLTVVDELPNCVPAVRAQLFNIFDGFVEINGKAFPFGNYLTATSPNGEVKILDKAMSVEELSRLRAEGAEIKGDVYSVGIATGNVGQRFTESSNDLGRALRDRMHVTVDVDHFHPTAYDSLSILDADTNPRVSFTAGNEDTSDSIVSQHEKIRTTEMPAQKLLAALYFAHGLDHCNTKKGEGSKRKMKDAWPTELPPREQSSIDGLVLPISMRGAKSVLRLSQSLDYIAKLKGATEVDSLDSMFQAYRLVAPHSGVLYSGVVDNTYSGDHYAAVDAVIQHARQEFTSQADALNSALDMVSKKKLEDKVVSKFTGRWGFMKNVLEGLVNRKDIEVK